MTEVRAFDRRVRTAWRGTSSERSASFRTIEAERTLLYASDYPRWDFDTPKIAFDAVPADLRRRIFVDNALDLYGDRLL